MSINPIELSKTARARIYLQGIIEAVKNVGCHDCGKKFKKELMTFDHLPEFKKEGDINYFVKLRSRRRLLIEMAKCDVVCRRCHDTREKRRGR